MKFSSLISATMLASAVSMFASQAQAFTFVSYGTALPTGETLVTDFSTGANVTGGGLVTGSQGGVTAAPAFSGAPTFDTAQYLTVLAGQSATLTFAATNEVSIYLGSLDSYNTLSFGGPGGATFTGPELGAVSGADSGDQTGPKTNGRFVFDFSAPVTSATFASSTNAFEVADVASVTTAFGPRGAAVPEPASWALMLVGFSGAGATLRSSRRRRAIA